MGLMNIELLVVPGCRNERTGGNFVAITAKAAWEDGADPSFDVVPRVAWCSRAAPGTTVAVDICTRF